MQFIFWTIGKTNSAEFAKWENDFTKRIKSFTPFDSDVLDAGRGLKNPDQIRAEEGKKVLSRLKTEDYLILLDEKGKTFTSREFANYLEKKKCRHHPESGSSSWWEVPMVFMNQSTAEPMIRFPFQP